MQKQRLYNAVIISGGVGSRLNLKKPKILDYSKLMQENIAQILNINSKRISIKGKTSESLGFIGRQEGIAAMVNTSIKMIDNIIEKIKIIFFL